MLEKIQMLDGHKVVVDPTDVLKKHEMSVGCEVRFVKAFVVLSIRLHRCQAK